MKHPTLQFKLNKELDKEMCFQFLSLKAAGIDFGAGITHLHPKLMKVRNTNERTQRDTISVYFEKYYKENNRDIEKDLRGIEENWESDRNEFYKAAQDLFLGYSWPSGEYICYLSIINCNPRFLENKTFQVYRKHPKGTNHVIAHEMLHFIFYYYFENKEAEYFRQLNDDQKWQISEVFNDIVLETAGFILFKPQYDSGYPELESLIRKYKANLDNNINITRFFEVSKKLL